MKYDYDVAIIGGGSGGLSTAYFCSQMGLKTILFEKKKMGGDCLNYGCVPSKALIKSSKINDLIKNSEKYGLDKIEDIEIDKSRIFRRVKKVIDTISFNDSVERYTNLGVKVIQSKAVFKDKHSIMAADKVYTSKYIIIASGATPRVPSIDGLIEVGFLTNESIFDVEELPESMVIMGGGPIAIELAMALAKLGVKIYLINRSSTILKKFDKEIRKIIVNKIKELPITMIYNAEINKIEKDSINKILYYSQDNETKILKVEEIFIAIGRVPNVQNMNLDKVGIKYDKKGIQVNKKLQTTQKNIYAIGDCIGQMQFTHVAEYEAKIAIKNMIFKIPSRTNYNNIPWVLYTDPEVASVGKNESDLIKYNIKYEKLVFSLKDNDRGITEDEKEGFVKILISSNKKILGATIVAPNAGEMIPLLVFIMENNMKINKLNEVVFAYPTMADIINRAVGEYYGKKLFDSSMAKRVVKLLTRF